VRLGRRETSEREMTEPIEPEAALGRVVVGGDHHEDTLGVQTAADEREHRGRLLVQPLGVVSDEQDRLFASDLGEEAEHRQSDHERIELVVVSFADDPFDHRSLGGSERTDSVDQRHHRLSDPSEAEPHLGLNAHRPREPEGGGAVERVLHERGLADSGRPLDQERAGHAFLCVTYQRVDRRSLAGMTDEEAIPRHLSCAIDSTRHGTLRDGFI
jgi:hypothetical protein